MSADPRVHPRVPSSNEDDMPIIRSLGDSLFEVTISRQNYTNFFADSVQNFSNNREEAEITLRNLHTWSPEVARFFQIRDPETLLATTFRLICESDLGYVPFDSEHVIRQFLAVSYCWRHDGLDWPQGTLLPPSPPWPFSRPFVEAVLAERGVHSDSPQRDANFRREGIWVDQMCIRQENHIEKQQSIAIMDTIYHTCRKLLILLEDVILTVDEVAALDAYIDLQFESFTNVASALKNSGLVNLQSICQKVENSRWWSRSWCWHEFEANKPWSDMRHHYYAHNATFIVNRESASSSSKSTYSFKYLALLWAWHNSMYLNGGFRNLAISRLLRWTISSNSTSPYKDPQFRKLGSERSSLLTRYSVVNLTGCSIASDMVSITINLTGLALSYTAQLQDLEHTFFTMCVLALACGEKTPLTWMSNSPTTENDCSWLSRPLGGFDVSYPNFAVGSVHGVHSITHRYIELDLLFFDAPVESITQEKLVMTYKVFPDTPIRSREIKSLDSRYPCFTETSEDEAARDDLRRKFLYASCRDGMAGVHCLWDLLDKAVVQPSFNTSRVHSFVGDEALQPAARALLEILAPTSELCTTTSTSYADAEEVLLLLLTFITDPRAVGILTPLSTLIKDSKDTHAILGFPVLRHPSDYRNLGDFQLAMPTDLVDYPATALRVWILQELREKEVEGLHYTIDKDSKAHGAFRDEQQSESTSNRWRLVGKCSLLRELLDRNINANTPFLRRRSHQVIQG
ncbi:hypothetical protein S7711_11413 [Stachybotrys chartarum IBT 7711]|uniref:Heterokaryon incompatibility domain-containing protein n=1 Tax=Stachybotrys chartarum (strain CBS 109288 / IBT 7711) TaxID=1280523 RepID=A0A084B872_STACB|nr:hypothetical protein S7711_11413 [Stachybotrys chartarum IBT 7711]